MSFDTPELRAIGERLRTQDNRCTADPIFQVRGILRIYGMDPDWAEQTVWVDTEDGAHETDPPEEPDNPGDFIIETGFCDHEEIVMASFSEVACHAYIKANGHRHRRYRELFVYADSLYRCPEMIAIRNALMSLPPPD